MSKTPSEPSDRRPLAAREFPVWKMLLPVFQRLGVTPNAVSGAGLLAGLASGAALAATGALTPDDTMRPAFLLAGGGLILLRGACNIFDGVLAVETGQSSRTGYLWNEFPDRLSDAATLVGAGYAAGGCPMAGWLAALVAVLVAYTRLLARVAGAPMDFCGPMAKPMRMAFVFAAAIAGALLPTAWQSAPWAGGQGWMAAALWIVAGGGAATIVRRLVRAIRTLKELAP